MSLFLFHVALILHSNVDLTCFPLLTNLLKGLVILWRVMKKNLILITPLISLHTCTCTLSFQRVLRVVGVVTGYFNFVIVNVCLFLYRQACRYLLIYVLWIYFRFIWSYRSFFSTLVLVFVTRVLALCRDGLKQMSDLPFFVLILFLSKKKLWHTELMTQNETSNAWAICRGWPMNYFAWKDSIVIYDFILKEKASGSRVCRHSYKETAALINCGGRAHS